VQHLDARLGVEVVYRDYGTACHLIDPNSHSLNWTVLRATLLDEFVLAHSLGWWAKALLIRNTGLLWVYSVAFELLELTFAVRRVMTQRTVAGDAPINASCAVQHVAAVPAGIQSVLTAAGLVALSIYGV
jgi:nitrate reductase gamma subunit